MQQAAKQAPLPKLGDSTSTASMNACQPEGLCVVVHSVEAEAQSVEVEVEKEPSIDPYVLRPDFYDDDTSGDESHTKGSGAKAAHRRSKESKDQAAKDKGLQGDFVSLVLTSSVQCY